MSEVRGGDGKYDRDPAVAQRDAEACRLRSQNLTYQQIADHLGIARTTAYESVQRALAETVREAADERRALELMQLDEMARAVRAVLERQHLVVSQGKVVRLGMPYVDEETGRAAVDEGRGEPLEDDAPVLQAVDRLLKIQERRAKLLGLDIPVKQQVEVDGGIRYEIVGVDLSKLT
ncbi:hypothetical protein J5X84_36210 [Streptosporangiaceae bacterium NEAU-GS5]|nr:hypothetical protein [Streptosporangiaceae bacterium NEAU-GS5]